MGDDNPPEDSLMPEEVSLKPEPLDTTNESMKPQVAVKEHL